MMERSQVLLVNKYRSETCRDDERMNERTNETRDDFRIEHQQQQQILPA